MKVIWKKSQSRVSDSTSDDDNQNDQATQPSSPPSPPSSLKSNNQVQSKPKQVSQKKSSKPQSRIQQTASPKSATRPQKSDFNQSAPYSNQPLNNGNNGWGNMASMPGPQWGQPAAMPGYGAGAATGLRQTKTLNKMTDDERKELLTRVYKLVLDREPTTQDLNYYRYSVLTEDKLTINLLKGKEHTDLVKDGRDYKKVSAETKDNKVKIKMLEDQNQSTVNEISLLKKLLSEKNQHLEFLKSQLAQWQKQAGSYEQTTTNTAAHDIRKDSVNKYEGVPDKTQAPEIDQVGPSTPIPELKVNPEDNSPSEPDQANPSVQEVKPLTQIQPQIQPKPVNNQPVSLQTVQRPAPVSARVPETPSTPRPKNMPQGNMFVKGNYNQGSVWQSLRDLIKPPY